MLKKYGVSIPYLEDEYGIPFEDEDGDYVEKSDEFRAMEIKKMEESDEFKKYTEMLLELSDFEFMKHIIGSNYLIYTEELYGDEEQKFRKIIAGLPDDNLAIVLHTVHKVRPSDSPIIGIFIDIAKERGILGKDIEKFSDINFEDDGINKYEEIAVLYKDMLYFTGGFSIIGVPLDYSEILVKSRKWIYDIGSSDPEVEDEYFRSREIAEKGYEFFKFLIDIMKMPDKDFLENLKYFYDKCLVTGSHNAKSYDEEFLFLMNLEPEKLEKIIEKNKKDNEKNYLKYLIYIFRRRILDLNSKYAGDAFNIYNKGNKDSEFRTALELFVREALKKQIKERQGESNLEELDGQER